MSVKIRLTRTGRHNDPFYRIVVADQRYARDGKYIEQIGYFDPNKGLASATLDEEKALTWLKNGATPSDTIRALFSERGLMTKHAATKSGKKPGKTKKPATKKASEAKKPAAKKESK